MAKKKRKHFIKLNNKVKSLFNNKPFEDAIADLDENTLYGLLMLLGKDIGSLKKIDIIKYIRRVWSEGNYLIRKNIVEYLEEIKKDQKKALNNKIDTIVSFLDDENATPQEIDTIIDELIDKKLSKITEKKVKRKLFYLRKIKILEKYSNKLDIEFVGIDSIEFFEPYLLKLEDKNIEIVLRYSTYLNINTSELIKKDHDDIIEYLNNAKKIAKKSKLEELSKFLNDIKSISYLSKDIVFNIFNSLNEPVDNFYYIPIPLKIIKKLIYSSYKDVTISLNKINFLISKTFKYKFSEEIVDYNIYLTYDKKTIYKLLWQDKIESVIKEIDEKSKKDMVQFELYYRELFFSIKESLYPLDLSEEEINKEIESFILPYIKSNNILELRDKLIKRVIYHTNSKYKLLKEKREREILLAKTIRDFKMLFPVARSLKREIIFHVGPTNSGKTYNALKELKNSHTGIYLAPLRLLALEGYENLKESGINVSLITGEEEIIDEESTHISSTIEMLNSDIEVDVCVIDEIQMIDDRDRGWAWANALIGAPAKKLILTGSYDALEVVKEIANYLNESLKVIEFKRKAPLKLLNKPVSVKKIEPYTAIVTFSRKDVLNLKSKISSLYTTSVVYGNLSPEVRREEARRFREGESKVLIATDAIAMGLNLPIKTILFAQDNKFDGLQRRELTTSEILQISGRAGRYGLHESGYVGALDHPTLSTVKNRFNEKLKPLKLPISVMASLEHVLLIGEILQTDTLYTILEFFSSNMKFDGPFIAANIESMLEIAKIVDEYKLDLISKYHLACAPMSIKSPHLEKAFHRYLRLLEQDKEVPFIKPNITSKKAVSYSALLTAEDIVKEVSLYLWLSFKFSEKFKDIEIAKDVRYKLNNYIENSLKESNFKKECRMCGKYLDFSYKFDICDKCYNRIKRGFKREQKRGLFTTKYK